MVPPDLAPPSSRSLCWRAKVTRAAPSRTGAADGTGMQLELVTVAIETGLRGSGRVPSICESLPRELTRTADVSPSAVTFEDRKLLISLLYGQNRTQEADGSIPFISTKLLRIISPQGSGKTFERQAFFVQAACSCSFFPPESPRSRLGVTLERRRHRLVPQRCRHRVRADRSRQPACRAGRACREPLPAAPPPPCRSWPPTSVANFDRGSRTADPQSVTSATSRKKKVVALATSSRDPR
jgi:hypothetical protein